MRKIWIPQSRSAITGLTLLRIAAGVIFAAHGWQKLVGFEVWHGHVVSMGLPYPDVMAALAVAGEFGGGLALALGLLTRVGAFGAACVMTVAILTVHLKHGLFAENNGFEYPLLLGLTAVFFMLRGAGPVSLDALWNRSRDSVNLELDALGRRHVHAHASR